MNTFNRDKNRSKILAAAAIASVALVSRAFRSRT